VQASNLQNLRWENWRVEPWIGGWSRGHAVSDKFAALGDQVTDLQRKQEPPIERSEALRDAPELGSSLNPSRGFPPRGRALSACSLLTY
jgi:hypothetical protein